MIVETVVALLMIVNSEIKEHRIQENLSTCLKGKRIAEREYSQGVRYQCIKSKTGIKRGFKKLEGVDQNVEFSLQNLRDDVGLIAEGDWQEVIFGLDPEDILMFESLIKSGDIFKNKARI